MAIAKLGQRELQLVVIGRDNPQPYLQADRGVGFTTNNMFISSLISKTLRRMAKSARPSIQDASWLKVSRGYWLEELALKIYFFKSLLESAKSF